MAFSRSPTSTFNLKNCGTSFFCPAVSYPLLRFPKEVIEPVLHQLQSLPFNSINAHAPFLFTAQQPRSFEHLQMTRRRLPRVREGCGDLTGAHRSSVEIHCQQNTPARRMGESGKHRLRGIETRC